MSEATTAPPSRDRRADRPIVAHGAPGAGAGYPPAGDGRRPGRDLALLQHPVAAGTSSPRATCGTCPSRARRSRSWPPGMVLIIVSRNIDLSVGSMLGFIGYTMAMVQVNWLPNVLGVSYHELVHLGRRDPRRPRDRRGDGDHHRLHRRVRRRSVLHRHSRRPPRRGAASSSGTPRARPSPRSTRTSSSSAEGPRGRSADVAAGSSGILACVAASSYTLLGQPAPEEAVRLPRPRDVGRDRRRRRRRARSSSPRSGSRTVLVAGGAGDPVRPGSRDHRAPGRPDHPHGHRQPRRRHLGVGLVDDEPRDPPPLRAIRVRDRRQPGRGRARRHQHPPDDHAHVHPHGRSSRRSARPSRRRA